eukprot:jgi/Mesvir1/3375/Mv15833-RA.2
MGKSTCPLPATSHDMARVRQIELTSQRLASAIRLLTPHERQEDLTVLRHALKAMQQYVSACTAIKLDKSALRALSVPKTIETMCCPLQVLLASSDETSVGAAALCESLAEWPCAEIASGLCLTCLARPLLSQLLSAARATQCQVPRHERGEGAGVGGDGARGGAPPRRVAPLDASLLSRAASAGTTLACLLGNPDILRRKGACVCPAGCHQAGGRVTGSSDVERAGDLYHQDTAGGSSVWGMLLSAASSLGTCGEREVLNHQLQCGAAAAAGGAGKDPLFWAFGVLEGTLDAVYSVGGWQARRSARNMALAGSRASPWWGHQVAPAAAPSESQSKAAAGLLAFVGAAVPLCHGTRGGAQQGERGRRRGCGGEGATRWADVLAAFCGPAWGSSVRVAGLIAVAAFCAEPDGRLPRDALVGDWAPTLMLALAEELAAQVDRHLHGRQSCSQNTPVAAGEGVQAGAACAGSKGASAGLPALLRALVAIAAVPSFGPSLVDPSHDPADIRHHAPPPSPSPSRSHSKLHPPELAPSPLHLVRRTTELCCAILQKNLPSTHAHRNGIGLSNKDASNSCALSKDASNSCPRLTRSERVADRERKAETARSANRGGSSGAIPLAYLAAQALSSLLSSAELVGAVLAGGGLPALLASATESSAPPHVRQACWHAVARMCEHLASSPRDKRQHRKPAVEAGGAMDGKRGLGGECGNDRRLVGSLLGKHSAGQLVNGVGQERPAGATPDEAPCTCSGPSKWGLERAGEGGFLDGHQGVPRRDADVSSSSDVFLCDACMRHARMPEQLAVVLASYGSAMLLQPWQGALAAAARNVVADALEEGSGSQPAQMLASGCCENGLPGLLGVGDARLAAHRADPAPDEVVHEAADALLMLLTSPDERVASKATDVLAAQLAAVERHLAGASSTNQVLPVAAHIGHGGPGAVATGSTRDRNNTGPPWSVGDTDSAIASRGDPQQGKGCLMPGSPLVTSLKSSIECQFYVRMDTQVVHLLRLAAFARVPGTRDKMAQAGIPSSLRRWITSRAKSRRAQAQAATPAGAPTEAKLGGLWGEEDDDQAVLLVAALRAFVEVTAGGSDGVQDVFVTVAGNGLAKGGMEAQRWRTTHTAAPSAPTRPATCSSLESDELRQLLVELCLEDRSAGVQAWATCALQRFGIYGRPSHLGQDMAWALQDEATADVRINLSDGTALSAHQGILACRSKSLAQRLVPFPAPMPGSAESGVDGRVGQGGGEAGRGGRGGRGGGEGREGRGGGGGGEGVEGVGGGRGRGGAGGAFADNDGEAILLACAAAQPEARDRCESASADGARWQVSLRVRSEVFRPVLEYIYTGVATLDPAMMGPPPTLPIMSGGGPGWTRQISSQAGVSAAARAGWPSAARAGFAPADLATVAAVAKGCGVPSLAVLLGGRWRPQWRGEVSLEFSLAPMMDGLDGEALSDIRMEASSRDWADDPGARPKGPDSRSGRPSDLPAHRVVLSARSEYFRALFSSGMKDSIGDRVSVPASSLAELAALRRYLYTDEIRLSQSMAPNQATTSPDCDAAGPSSHQAAIGQAAPTPSLMAAPASPGTSAAPTSPVVLSERSGRTEPPWEQRAQAMTLAATRRADAADGTVCGSSARGEGPTAPLSEYVPGGDGEATPSSTSLGGNGNAYGSLGRTASSKQGPYPGGDGNTDVHLHAHAHSHARAPPLAQEPWDDGDAAHGSVMSDGITVSASSGGDMRRTGHLGLEAPVHLDGPRRVAEEENAGAQASSSEPEDSVDISPLSEGDPGATAMAILLGATAGSLLLRT